MARRGRDASTEGGVVVACDPHLVLLIQIEVEAEWADGHRKAILWLHVGSVSRFAAISDHVEVLTWTHLARHVGDHGTQGNCMDFATSSSSEHACHFRSTRSRTCSDSNEVPEIATIFVQDGLQVLGPTR